MGSSRGKAPPRGPQGEPATKKRRHARSTPPREELPSINTELEMAKAELRSSNEKLATLNQELQDRSLQLARALDYANRIVEMTRDPLLILDRSLRVERASRAFYDHFQVAPEETEGHLLHELGNGRWDIPPLRRALEEVFLKGAPLHDVEVEHEFPKIGCRILVVNARTLHHESGHERILLVLGDKTPAKSTAKGRATLLPTEQGAWVSAEEADRIKDEFVATLSHELRGPLNAMVGWVQILRDSGIDEATKERGRAAIERGVKAQTRLIEDLLDYSRMVTGKLRLVQRLTDLVPVAEAAVEGVRSAADAKEIRFQVTTESAKAMVLGDPDRLQQVALNLVSNAVKFTPRGGHVEVWIGRVGTSMRLRVSDTGQGIARDFLPHVFERFRQAVGGPGRIQSGLGLGLSIVKQLVQLHGGSVEADSPGEGEGATFTVALPIPPLLLHLTDSGQAEVPMESTAAEKAWTELDRTMLEGVRLLVVEDEADSREMLVTAFEQCGAQVSVASSAREAMEVLRRVIPDAVVCDIGLPGEDGHEFIRKVRGVEVERGGRIPALALTAYAGPEDRKKALAAGFDMHVAKPAAPADLVARVALLAGSRGK